MYIYFFFKASREYRPYQRRIRERDCVRAYASASVYLDLYYILIPMRYFNACPLLSLITEITWCCKSARLTGV